jgi:hypothetical protein
MKLTLLFTSLLASLAVAAPAPAELDARAAPTCQYCQQEVANCIKILNVNFLSISSVIKNAPGLKLCQDKFDKCKKDAATGTSPVSTSLLWL